MGKQDDSYFGIVHRAEQAQLNGERATAPNTPTPELVERLRKEIPYNADGFRELRDLADEAAAAIAKLTAERDAWRLSAETLKSQIQMDRAEHEAVLKIAEAAEKRVKELEVELKETYEERKEFGDWQKEAARASRAEAANKLLSERVAVLEKDCADIQQGADEFWAELQAFAGERGKPVSIEHDGFSGTIQGAYTTREGKRGVVLQQHGTKVVHAYGEKWIKPEPDAGVAAREAK